MQYDVSVDPATGWGHVRVSGEVRLEEFPDALAAMWSDPAYAGTQCAVWDFSAAQSGWHLPEVVNITTYIAAAKSGRGPTTIAIVASRDLEFGIGRMFAAFADKCGYTINVVRTPEAAHAWLAGQPRT